jgi:hypothetical protein
MGAAADRGVSVTFGIDAFAMLDQRSFGPVVIPASLSHKREVIEEQQAMLESLAVHPNAQFGVLNQPKHSFTNLFAGRSHMKLDVIDKYFSLGGVCLQDCQRIDMMVGMKHEATADWLYGLTKSITEAGSTRDVLGSEDKIWDINEQTKILIDAGVPGQSVIQEDALELIDESEEWLTVACQFLPTGRTADHIVKAIERGVDVNVIYNNPAKHDRLNFVHRYYDVRERRRRPPEFFGHELSTNLPPLHAKAMANEKRGAVGGHNFLDLGVRFGTAEISLTQKSPAFAQAVRALLDSQIKYKSPLAA